MRLTRSAFGFIMALVGLLSCRTPQTRSPTTSDTFTYDGLVWRIVEIAPTYSAATLIASKIKGRA